MPLRRLLLLLAMFCLAAPAAPAALAAGLGGYAPELEEDYPFATFGVYPYEEDGAQAPVLWRVLGPGTPQEGDVIGEHNIIKRDEKKLPNGDDLEGENSDVVCLMTEYLIDFILYHDVRDEVGGEGLDYRDTLICAAMNGEVLGRMFTEAERAALVPMPERGLLGLPTRRGELFRTDYGFVSEDFTKCPRRTAVGTPYAYAKGLKMIKGHSWYWTADWRRYGARWIVGDDGHISVSGLDRQGGVRAVCYVHQDMLKITGGTGSREDPYRLSVQ